MKQHVKNLVVKCGLCLGTVAISHEEAERAEKANSDLKLKCMHCGYEPQVRAFTKDGELALREVPYVRK
ncbi:MAG: hypothetical protein EOP09_06040 [Proteobacteria bacterium]|nr:MAG: hypothetical protein EOP09_06040 [Pseudomonadota bacterium]